MSIPLEEIRRQEKQYHDQYYSNHELFSAHSWLDDPVPDVINGFMLLPPRSDLCVLDLGCGVGRNSIPLAQRLPRPQGRILCVDLLDSAITYLKQYAAHYGVTDRIMTIRSDVEHFPIAAHTYDYVVAVSVLEHLSTPAIWHKVITSLQQSTRPGGIHCFQINTDITETDGCTGEQRMPMFELRFSSHELLAALWQHYTACPHPWTIIEQRTNWHTIEIEREGRPVHLNSNMLTWIVQKTGG